MNEVSLLSASTAAQAAAAGKARPQAGDVDRQTLRKRAIEFEAIYLAQMLQPMFDGLKTEEPFGGGFGEDVWRSQQVQEYGKAIAESGRIGIADAVARQLIQAQEAREGARR
jgi:Rod binding domain-containing protein